MNGGEPRVSYSCPISAEVRRHDAVSFHGKPRRFGKYEPYEAERRLTTVSVNNIRKRRGVRKIVGIACFINSYPTQHSKIEDADPRPRSSTNLFRDTAAQEVNGTLKTVRKGSYDRPIR